MRGEEGGAWALATGAGKDATLALHRAREAGLHVPLAFSVVEGNTGRIRFHGTPEGLVRDQTEALGLELLTARTHPDDYEAVYRDLLSTLVARGFRGVVYGNVHLADVRGWYEERTSDAGLEHHEPLWGEPPARVVRAFVRAGFRAVVAGVDLSRGDPAWLGREMDEGLVRRIAEAGCDPCGEFGEYHTFVWDGPGFRSPVAHRWHEELERDGHRFLALEPV